SRHRDQPDARRDWTVGESDSARFSRGRKICCRSDAGSESVATIGTPLRRGTGMKALVKSKAEPGLWLEDTPDPEIGLNDVLIRIDRTGICGTDGHIYQWDDWARKTIRVPMVVGHEFVG